MGRRTLSVRMKDVKRGRESAELSGSSDREGVRHAPMKQKGGESDKEGQKKRR